MREVQRKGGESIKLPLGVTEDLGDDLTRLAILRDAADSLKPPLGGHRRLPKSARPFGK